MTRQSEIDVATVLEQRWKKKERKKRTLHKGRARARESNYVTVIASLNASRCFPLIIAWKSRFAAMFARLSLTN